MLTKKTSFRLVNVLIADDHEMFRRGVKMTLKNIQFVNEILEADSGNDALQIVDSNPIDIVLMDITMKDGNGISTTKIISEKYPDVGVIALSMHEDESSIVNMIKAGALGYLFKNTDEDELREAIVCVYNKGNYFTQNLQITNQKKCL